MIGVPAAAGGLYTQRTKNINSKKNKNTLIDKNKICRFQTIPLWAK